METRVKERLVGAIILVTLIVLLAPELLSGPKRPSAATPQATESGVVRTYTIDFSGSGRSAPDAVGGIAEKTPARSSEKPSEKAPVSDSRLPEQKPQLGPPVLGKQATAATPGATVVRPPSAAQSVSPSPTPIPTPVEPSANSKPVAPAEPQVPAAAHAPQARASAKAPASGWAVQLGSFSSADNAERLVKELRAHGYKAFISRSGTGSQARHRVRVGPEPDRARAEGLAQGLRREGRQAAIVPQT
jgi:DedD protein